MTEKLLNYFKGDELASSAWAKKYKQENEETPDDMHRRLAKEFARVESNYISGELLNPDRKEILSKYGKRRTGLTDNKIFSLFKDFKYVIPQGSVMSNLGNKDITSLSNCFVVASPEDSYGGIFKSDQELAQLMKRRGGVGIDISTLRPEGTTTSNAAKTSTGAISFMHRFSNTTREVAQNGRRGALMLSIDINHPDVLEFIKIKRDLSQVTGANISVKLNDEFMRAVENDKDYILRFPCDIEDSKLNEIILGNELKTESSTWNTKYELNTLYEIEDKVYIKIIKAKEYWDEIIKSAHNVAEPGLMFWDNMVDYSPDGVYPQFRQVTTNPCSEIAMQPHDACRLIAVNLFSFVENPFTEKAYFNFEKFYEVNYEAMRLSDDLIDLELEHINRIINKIHLDPEPLDIKQTELDLWDKVKTTAMASRRTGLGFTALGDALAALGLKYDSGKALNIVEQIMHIKMVSELDCTTDLAILRGAFEGWDKNKEFKHNDDADLEGMNDFYNFICDNFPKQAKRLYYYGRRNVSFSTVAPTGTVSLLAQTTSGIEPLFQPFYIRRKKVNRDDKDARVDFTDQNGDTWQEFPVLHQRFKEWIQLWKGDYMFDGSKDAATKEELEQWFKESPWYGSTANDIDWIKRVRMQSIIQSYITHSISSTINLPEDVTEEEVSEIYLESWKQGVKGITVYRDGSRSGVLVTNTEPKETFTQHDAPKRPNKLECNIHTTVSKGVKWNVFVGLMENKPYEVFAIPYFTDIEKGFLVKIKRGRYDLLSENGETYSEDVTSEMNSEQEVITRLTSTSLRHGADIKFVVEQLNKSYGDITSFSKAVARVLKRYIPDGTKSTVSCNDCNSTNVIFEEGCHKCLDCGSSACS